MRRQLPLKKMVCYIGILRRSHHITGATQEALGQSGDWERGGNEGESLYCGFCGKKQARPAAGLGLARVNNQQALEHRGCPWRSGALARGDYGRWVVVQDESPTERWLRCGSGLVSLHLKSTLKELANPGRGSPSRVSRAPGSQCIRTENKRHG